MSCVMEGLLIPDFPFGVAARDIVCVADKAVGCGLWLELVECMT